MNEDKIYSFIKSKRGIYVTTLALIFIFVIIWILFVIDDSLVKKISVGEYEQGDVENYDIQIEALGISFDNLAITNEDYVINGWIRKHDVNDIHKVSVRIISRNVEDDVWYELPTTLVQRDDIDDGIPAVGFYVTIPGNYNMSFGDEWELYCICDFNGLEEVISLDKAIQSWEDR